MSYTVQDGQELIDQFPDTYENRPILTAVKAYKWYEFHLLHPNGKVTPVPFDYEPLLDGWRDHCIVPASFHELADLLDASYSSETFAEVCRRFVDATLDGDWTKLHCYLPRA